MSLVVWLPLTKDLRNQGLDNVTVTNNGAVFNSAGKLGGCYSFDGSDDGIRIDGDIIPQLQQNNFSICFWLFSNDAGDRSIYIATTPASDYGFSIEKTTANKLRVYWQGNPDFNSSLDIPDQQWCHIAVVIKDGNCYCYKNGEKLAERTSGDMTPAKLSRTWIYAQLGRDTRTGNTVLKGKMNDFRWYDHALSQMEVKELSKGLVLHYPLNRQGWGQENQLKNSSFVNGTNSWYGVNSSSIRVETKDGRLCGTGTKGTSNHIIGQTSASYAGGTVTDITVSAKVYVTETGTFNVGHWISTSQASGWQSISGVRIWNTTNELSIGWNNVSTTLKNATNQYTGNIVTSFSYTGTTFWITDIKLEFGEIATPWCPNSSDELATTMGLNGTTEYDCSGFGNNGIRSGTFNWVSDTPKYQVSTYINSTSSKIHISNFPTSGFGNSYTFAWWGKRSSVSTMFWGFSDGIRLNGMYTGRLWNTGDSNDNPLYKIGTTTQVTAPSTGVWYHYAMIGNGTKCYVYLNGELWAEAKTYKAISGTSIYINGWDSSTSYSSSYMLISDFRIYATALSADDVKSLYQNSAYIDSSGNVYGAVHSEV